MPVYKSKLKSIGDSSGVSLETYYADNSPYTGYVILSKSISDNTYGLFNDKNVTKEYLSRGDSNALIGPNYAVDLSSIYKQSIGPAGDNHSTRHLACAALGKNIGNDNNYFYHYMDINDDANIVEGGFPFNDDDGNNSIITPYRDEAYSRTIYANFAVLGMSKAATPYINAGLFLEDCNHETLSDKTSVDYVGSLIGGDKGIYEFPGYSGLSTMFAEILWKGAIDAWANSEKTYIIRAVLNNDYAGRTLDAVISRVAYAIRDKIEEGVTGSYYDPVQLKNVSSVISNLAITNGQDFYSMELSNSYTPDASPTHESTSVDKLEPNDINYPYGAYCAYRIKFVAAQVQSGNGGNDYWSTYTTYFAVYSSSFSSTGGTNEFKNNLSYYYSNYNEPIILDHISTSTTASNYKLDTNENVLDTSSGASSYYVVARPTGPFLDLGSDSNGIPEKAMDKLKVRHTSYITRYEAIGLDTHAYHSYLATNAHPLMTASYMLDSSIVSVMSTVTPAPVAFNKAKAEKSGKVYVSSITLHFKGDTTSFTNKIKISSAENTKSTVFALDNTTYVCSGENTTRTSYKIDLASSNSVAFIGYDGESNTAPIKLGMTCDICGSHQMVRYNCGYMCKSYIDHLTNTDAGIDSQWTLLKLSGVFKIQMSGRNVYSTSENNDTDIILEAVDVEITDETRINVGIKYITPTSYNIDCTTIDFTHIKNLYKGLTQRVMKENANFNSYTAKCVFFNSLCGAKRMNINEYYNEYYNDAGILSNNWAEDADKNRKVSVYANGLDYPVIAIGGYGNGLASSTYVGAAYGKANVSGASFATSNDPVVPTLNSYNKIQAGAETYKKVTGDTSINDLNISFSTSNTLRYSLPKPDVKLMLDYKSVEFNGSSAWTFTRSMPLNAASAANPHILIYKIEAWVETNDENGNLIIDKAASAAITISDINGDNAHKVFSGRTHISNGVTLYGVDHAVEESEILNNLYLKYNDNETYIYNAVSTSLPIKLLEPASLPLGENNTFIDIVDFYGGNALNYVVTTSDYTNNDETNIQNMYSVIKSNISSEVQICLCSCAGTEDDMNDGVSLTKDGKKVIYFGIGFYNNSDLIMPITASYGIDLTIKDLSTGATGTYPKRISLNEFFPKDSILYMSGKNPKNSINSEENTKIRFVKSGESHLLNDNGLKTYDRAGTLTSSDIQEGETVNIGGGIIKDSASHNEGEIHASSIETSGDKVTSLYGIFNIYSGEVNYISTGSSKITNAGIPDVLKSSDAEDPSTGAYSNYVKFMNEISGKCLTRAQHICKFVHCDNNENGGIPYIL